MMGLVRFGVGAVAPAAGAAAVQPYAQVAPYQVFKQLF
jgi:hypothetical protein